ncbi:slipin family protein [Bacillus sp. CECT 9360]|uniref:slipin family protein n=1 Tax=Bacillus sp. CECT 9360 TaxID=2845821 RepID=UPI001E65A273|nr:slipin family protein [Bacillus sp. CECT 9360]
MQNAWISKRFFMYGQCEILYTFHFLLDTMMIRDSSSRCLKSLNDVANRRFSLATGISFGVPESAGSTPNLGSLTAAICFGQFCRLRPPLSISLLWVDPIMFIPRGEKMFEVIFWIAIVFISIAGIWSIVTKFIRSVTIFAFEKGVRFHNGTFKDVVGPGRYTYLTSSTRLEVFDMRPAVLQINGQELLSADHVGVKISLAVTYKVTDPQTLLSEYKDYDEYLYTTIQFKLREAISSMEMDEILNKRQSINEKVKELLINDVSLSGLSIRSVDLKDIMLSADLKKAFAEVIKVKKEALASLEKARGETATLRSLANAAKLIENNPELARLRLIQTIESSQGNTFVIDTGQNKQPE